MMPKPTLVGPSQVLKLKTKMQEEKENGKDGREGRDLGPEKNRKATPMILN